jgi:hypothetical protein
MAPIGGSTFRRFQYRALKSSGSLKAFYDDIVYWEIAKNTNKFFVTFMRGEYGFPNGLQESIGTMEISYPHTALGFNDSTGSYTTGFNRVSAKANTFFQNEESSSVTNAIQNSHNYNGFIPVTELKGLRYFQTTITSSISSSNTYRYQIYDSGMSPTNTTIDKTFIASYFYPFSSHQLSVLRDEPTLIVDLTKESELYNGSGNAGFVIVPENCHPTIKKNIEYYLEKAGLITKTTKFKDKSIKK